MNTIQANAAALARAHDFLSVAAATSLLLHAYIRFKDQARYGGNIVQTLLKVEYSILLRSSEAELMNRLAIAREFVG